MRNPYHAAEYSISSSDDAEDRLKQLIRLRSQRGRVLTAADEDKLLEDAVTRLGVPLDKARGILHSELEKGQISLESDLEETTMELMKALAGDRKALSRRDFEAVASFYASRRKVPFEASRQSVKRLMEEEGISPKRAGILRTKRWYKRIKA